MKTMYICELPPKIQQKLYSDLEKLGWSDEILEKAMSSRLCDLADTIDITKYLPMT